jgi:uncharacterized protein
MIIEKKIELNINDFFPKQIGHEIVFFDIETSGLSSKASEIFIGGVVSYAENQFLLQQYFSENSINEYNLLSYISDLFSTKKYIVTYNGINFDIPFYIKRCEKFGILNNLENKIFIDLYYFFKPHIKKLALDNMKQQTLEEHFKISRLDELNGEDIIKLLTAYRISPKKTYEELMLEHNKYDVINMFHLFNHFINIDSKAFVKSEMMNYRLYFIEKYKIYPNRNLLKMKIKTFQEFNHDIIINAFMYKIYWYKQLGKIEIEFIFNETTDSNGEIFKYINLKDYNLDYSSKKVIIFKNNVPIHQNIINLINLLIQKI